MSVTCWIRVEELKKFMREKCGVETLSDRHTLVSFRMNPDGDLFLHFDRVAKKKGTKVKGKKKGKR